MFFERSGEKYGLDEREIKILREIIHLGKKHRNSEFEIVKNDKVAIFDDYGIIYLSLGRIREYFNICKKLLQKTNRQFSTIFRKV